MNNINYISTKNNIDMKKLDKLIKTTLIKLDCKIVDIKIEEDKKVLDLKSLLTDLYGYRIQMQLFYPWYFLG
jgi:hypothetical protein